MSIIHMNISQTRNLVSHILSYTDQMWTATSSMNRSVSNINYAWQGVGANNYVEHLRGRIQSLEASIEQMEQLARLLSSEIDEREQIDALGVSNLRAGSNGLIAVSTSAVAGVGLKFGAFSASSSIFTDNLFEYSQGGLVLAGVGGVSLNLRGEPLEPFDWGDWGKNIYKDSLEFASEFSGEFIEWAAAGLGSAGLFSNTAFYGLSEIVRSDQFDVGTDFFTNIVNGVADGESAQFALTSSIISSGVKEGLKYLVPGVSQAMFISGGIQLVGHMASGIMSGLGYESEAQVLNNVLDTVDLDGYIDDFSDAITDWVFNPSEPVDFSDMGERATKFTCGLDFELNAEFSSSVSINVH